MAKNKDTQPEKGKKAKKPPAEKNSAAPQVTLPLFAEVFFSFSTLILLLVTLVIVLVSFMSGAALMEVFLRAVVGVVSLGSVLWFLTYQVSSSLANSRAAEQAVRQEAAAKSGQVNPHTEGEAQSQPSTGEVKE